MIPNEVEFTVSFANGVDINQTKSELEQMADNLKITDEISSRSKLWSGKTSPSTYEKLFKAKLTYKLQWEEVKNAEVPQEFKDKITSVQLVREYQVLQ